MEAEGSCGVRVSSGDLTWEVTLAATGELGGHVKRTGTSGPIDVDLTTAVEPQAGIMAVP
jgi:hypothetical protein